MSLQDLDFERKEIQDYIEESLHSSTFIYTPITETPEKLSERGWEFIHEQDVRVTFVHEIEAIMGEELANVFVRELSRYLSEELSGNLRSFVLLSSDVEDFTAIRREARKSFSSDFRNTHFYISAGVAGKHLQADAMHPPIRRGSVNFLSSIEGYPFHFNGLFVSEHLEIAAAHAALLDEGGIAVYFPWRVQGQTEKEKHMLRAVESWWKHMGLKVSRRHYTTDELQEFMADREYVMVDQSPVFKEKFQKLPLLILEKPKTSRPTED